MRYLMVDRILEFERFRRVEAIKNVTLESDVFEHHFRGAPLFPGALSLEALAQAAGYLVVRTYRDDRNELRAAALAMIERVQFRRPVSPGDQLRLSVAVDDWHESVVHVTVHAAVEGEVTARGRLVIGHRPIDPAVDPVTAGAVRDWLTLLERPAAWP